MLQDNKQEVFPVVDADGNTIGSATRGECHNGSRLLHPVVHLHLFNSKGELYLQKRPDWKDIQPGKWDTAVGGHIDYGETPENALRREVREELGITDFQPQFVEKYIFESKRERELVYVNRATYDGPIHPSNEELAGGRFWTLAEIRAAIGQGILTPNFESEFQRCFPLAITEQPSYYDNLEQMPVLELLQHINEEDCRVAEAVKQAIPQIQAFVEAVEERMKQGGRLFYVGAGTSGRLGVLDASELPPTFGVSDTKVIGLIAGGDRALRHAVEKAEDMPEQGWQDLQPYHPTAHDTVLGIAASGTTPYVVGVVRLARLNGLLTGCITSNPHTPLAETSDFAIETIVGPEFVTGSSRMKSGTAQKMVLNMISTALMIRLGRVQGNRMVNMQLTNAKLVDRGTRMVQDMLGLSYEEAQQRLLKAGSVDEACATRCE
jgi:N-acetylmuramic acid 6-phosphate etherase